MFDLAVAAKPTSLRVFLGEQNIRIFDGVM